MFCCRVTQLRLSPITNTWSGSTFTGAWDTPHPSGPTHCRIEVGLVDGAAVDEELAIAVLDRFTREGDHPLDQVTHLDTEP